MTRPWGLVVVVVAVGAMLAGCKREGPPKAGLRLVYAAAPGELSDESAKVVEKRLRAAGFTELAVKVAQDRLQLEIGPADQAELRAITELQGRLEISLVRDLCAPPEGVIVTPDGVRQVKVGTNSYWTSTDKELLLKTLAALETDNDRIAVGKELGEYRSYLLEKRALALSAHITDATAEVDAASRSGRVNVTFDDVGARALAEITGNNIGRQLAILLDGEVMSGPVVMEAITGGKASITMGQTADPKASLSQAQMLAIALRSGALPRLKLERVEQFGK